MDAEAHVDAPIAQRLGDLRDRVLAVGDGEAVARHDDHLLGALEQLCGRVDVGERGLALGHVGGAVAGRDGGGGAEAAEEHRDDVAVHGDAHDVREDRARRADERADGREQGLVEHEALCAECPARVRVEHGDDDRHVRAADRRRHVPAERARQARHTQQAHRADGHRGLRDEEGHAAERADAHADVQLVAHGEGERRGGHVAVELAEGHHRARRRHAADDRREGDGRRAQAVERFRVVRGVLEEVADAREDGGEADERVEGGDGLWERRRVDPLGDHVAEAAAAAEHGRELDVIGHRPVEGADRGGEAEEHTALAGDEAEARRLLRGEARDAADAAERRARRDRRRHQLEAREGGGRVAGGQRDGGHAVVLVKLWRVVGPLEHVEHLLGDEEAAGDVDRGDARRQRCQRLGRRRRHHAAAHNKHASDGRHARDGVRDGHQRRVERVRDAPDHLVPDDAREGKGGEHRRERRVGREHAHPERAHGRVARALGRRRVQSLVVVLRHDDDLFGGRLGRRRRRRGRRPRPCELALVHHHHTAHGDVLVVDGKLALGLRGRRARREEPLDLVVCVQRRRRRREARVEVGVAEEGDAILGDVLLVLDRARDVATRLRRQVDAHGAGLELCDHVGVDERRRLLAGDERRGDDDVDLLALLGEHLVGGGVPLSRHLLGVPARALAALLKVDLEELGAHRLRLLLDGGTHVEQADDRAHVLRGLHGGQAGDAATEHEHLGRRHFARRRHLASEEAAELAGSLNDCAIACDVRLRREGVEGLAARERPRDAIHGKHRGLLLGELVHELLVLRRKHEGQ
mmetsp:Transcript_46358/g.121648  ORF Transcript_46358/g.121648 Transcript_46358/m.121648 type:complete len:809 (+) Transcript_46358:937-3363(+)